MLGCRIEACVVQFIENEACDMEAYVKRVKTPRTAPEYAFLHEGGSTPGGRYFLYLRRGEVPDDHPMESFDDFGAEEEEAREQVAPLRGKAPPGGASSDATASPRIPASPALDGMLKAVGGLSQAVGELSHRLSTQLMGGGEPPASQPPPAKPLDTLEC